MPCATTWLVGMPLKSQVEAYNNILTADLYYNPLQPQSTAALFLGSDYKHVGERRSWADRLMDFSSWSAVTHLVITSVVFPSGTVCGFPIYWS